MLVITNGLLQPFAPLRPEWDNVEPRFVSLLRSLAISDDQFDDGLRKQAGVRVCLNQHYYGYPSETANSLITGSWGKQLRVRPPRDVDVLFVLPWSVYWRFQSRLGNRQSQILQEVKSALASRYRETVMRGDGQAVVVNFWSMPVEVVPAFRFDNGQFWICDTTDGGRYITTDPAAEIASLNHADAETKGAARFLIRMMKQWQRHCSVPLKSFLIERIAIEFIYAWMHDPLRLWYDWMARDFFGHLISRAGGWTAMPGTGRLMPMGDGWLSRALTAHSAATSACALEQYNLNELAGEEWQKIFGPLIPKIA